MDRFSQLLDSLSTTPSRNGKIRLLVAYFQAAPDPDRGWGLAALTDGLPHRVPIRRLLQALMPDLGDPVLYQLSRDYVGDTAETVALLWPERSKPHATAAPLDLNTIVQAVGSASPAALPPLIRDFLDRLDARGRWALLKLLGGAPRVGVSARLARIAIATLGGRSVSDIEEIWHALAPPYAELFGWLDGRSPRPDPGARPVFRPVMLAHPIEDADWQSLAPDDVFAEWKWDGIRVQIAARDGAAKIFSRAGDDISPAFPDIARAFAGRHGVADGELLILRDGAIAPFNDLQQRLNRKTVPAKLEAAYPAHVRLYDLLFDGDEDLRPLPLDARRQRLEAWHGKQASAASDVSELVPFTTFGDLKHQWSAARDNGIEGLMLKRKASPYLPGRVKGHWFKWKRAALTLDCVLMYAQRGSGKRSSFYSDYTFGVWRAESDFEAGLVPVGKAYSGFTDSELRDLDRWIRDNTTEQFGPVRAVKPALVLEVAFDAVQRSKRHKSGVAMRFPRIHRIRWDKPAREAETLANVLALLSNSAARNVED